MIDVVQFIRGLVADKYHLPMTVVDCEYQFDRDRLTVFYLCNERVDFRDLLKEVCAALTIRIWMKHITSPVLALNVKAAAALATGVYVAA